MWTTLSIIHGQKRFRSTCSTQTVKEIKSLRFEKLFSGRYRSDLTVLEMINLYNSHVYKRLASY